MLDQAATGLQTALRGLGARRQVEEAKKSKAAADAAKEKLAAAKAAEAAAAAAPDAVHDTISSPNPHPTPDP